MLAGMNLPDAAVPPPVPPLELGYAPHDERSGLRAVLALVAAMPLAIVGEDAIQLCMFGVELIFNPALVFSVIWDSLVPLALAIVRVAAGAGLVGLVLRARRDFRLRGVAAACAVFAAIVLGTGLASTVYDLLFVAFNGPGWRSLRYAAQSVLIAAGRAVLPLLAYGVLRRWNAA